MRLVKCNICGSTHRVNFYFEKGCQNLCLKCAAETPLKLMRNEFEFSLWGDQWSTVPGSTRYNFYDDYRTSKLDFEAYKQQTSEVNVYG